MDTHGGLLYSTARRIEKVHRLTKSYFFPEQLLPDSNFSFIILFQQLNCQEDGARLIEIESADETLHMSSIIEQSKTV